MKKWLAILALECLSMLMCNQSLVQKRRCAFQVKAKRQYGYSAAGNVSDSVQICENTHCCLAIYKIRNGHMEVDTLACEKTNKVCPDETCEAKPPFENHFIACRCGTDLCNRNISWSLEPGPEMPPETHLHGPAEIIKILCVVFPFLLVFIIIAAKWISLKKETKKHLQSTSNDYNVEELCSCQARASWNQITDIELQGVLGRGGFATVYQGMHRNTVVAVKVYTANSKHQFDNEREVYELPLMKHEGIAMFLGTGMKPNDGSLLILLQYAENGSLHSFLCKHASSWAASMKLCQTLSEGLSYLHSDLHSNDLHKPPVAHGDLSSSNVLVRADGTCFLCDFGSSTILRSCSRRHFWEDHSRNLQFGTLNYMSPELLEGSVNLGRRLFLLQGDIYALSLVLWEIWMRCSDLFTGGAVPEHLLPYELELQANVTLDRLIFYVSKDGRPSIPESWDVLPQGPELKNLLTDCWDNDADARLTAPCVVSRLRHLKPS